MECQYCNNIFKNKSILTSHQKSASYCLQIQGKNSDIHTCVCKKTFSSKYNYLRHINSCNTYMKENIIKEQEEKYKKLLKEHILLVEHKKELKEQEEKHSKELKEQEEKYKKELKEQEEKHTNILKEIITETIKGNFKRIKYLENKYLKRQPREQYSEKNVIYILTTESLKKDNIYILGKTTNLTNRLSTYNKTCDHQVIYYRECQDKETMNIAEPIIFNKLKNYKEVENRERFILPKNKDISLFINQIDSCIDFLS